MTSDPTTTVAAAEGWDLLERFALPVLLAAIAFAGALGGVLLGQWAAERERRRGGYAAAVRALIAWHEYPYRIRRRTDDEPATLAALARLGHELQEDLQFHQTWASAENRRVGKLYTGTVKAVAAACAQACTEAWEASPADTPGAMNLNGWGTKGVHDELAVLQTAIGNRFGWRRALAVNWWTSPGLP